MIFMFPEVLTSFFCVELAETARLVHRREEENTTA
jgi:hypothetical protein